VRTAHPRGGVDYPRSAGAFQPWFATDEDCLNYLDWLRWPQGFVCPRCENPGGWLVADGSYKCSRCNAQTAVTAGTLFDRRRSPLTVWFAACWMFASQKDGISALSLQRSLEIGSYPTAWAMLHRLRAVLVRPGRDRLTGAVEVDETYFGGEEPGLRGGRAKGKKALVAVAVERKEPHGYGRCRMAVVRDGSAESLQAFVSDTVEPGFTVVTDGWPSYVGVTRLGYLHEPHSQRAATASGEDVGALLPGVHRVASLAKRWMLGTHQGRYDAAHLQSYLNVHLPLQPPARRPSRAAVLPTGRAGPRGGRAAEPAGDCRRGAGGHGRGGGPMIEVRVPKVGMSTSDVEVSSIQVRVGDRVAPTSVVVSVAADKVDFDIEAGAAGVVEELLVEEGSVVDVGTVVARIREDG